MLYCITGWFLIAAFIVAFTLWGAREAGWKTILGVYALIVSLAAFIAVVGWLIQHCPKC